MSQVHLKKHVFHMIFSKASQAYLKKDDYSVTFLIHRFLGAMYSQSAMSISRLMFACCLSQWYDLYIIWQF